MTASSTGAFRTDANETLTNFSSYPLNRGNVHLDGMREAHGISGRNVSAPPFFIDSSNHDSLGPLHQICQPLRLVDFPPEPRKEIHDPNEHPGAM